MPLAADTRVTPRDPGTPLTEAQVAQFHDQGFVVMDPEIPEALLDAVVQEMEPIYQQQIHPQTGGGRPNRVQDAWRGSPAVHAVATWARIKLALDQLYGRSMRPFQTLNFPRGTEQLEHQDTIHFNSDPAGFMAGAWVALEAMDLENGPLMYYPGSHRLPEYTMQDFGLRPTADDYPHYEQALIQVLAEQGLERHLATIPKGQCLLWSCSLIHGGSPQKDKSRSRHSQVTHYFGEGLRYYTPMFSTPGQKCWRHPDWIR